MNEQPGEEIRQDPEGSQVQELLCLWSWAVHTFPAASCVHQPRSSPRPVLLGFGWRFRHVGMVDYEFPAPPENGEGQGVTLKVSSF